MAILMCPIVLENPNAPVSQPLLFLAPSPPTLSSVYPSILTQVRKIMISRMAKPQEVLIVIDENGQPTKEIIQDSEVTALYEIMKEVSIFLVNIYTFSLFFIVDGQPYSFGLGKYEGNPSD